MPGTGQLEFYERLDLTMAPVAGDQHRQHGDRWFPRNGTARRRRARAGGSRRCVRLAAGVALFRQEGDRIREVP